MYAVFYISYDAFERPTFLFIHSEKGRKCAEAPNKN